MTKEKLFELVRISNKIDELKRDIEVIEKIKNDEEDIYLIGEDSFVNDGNRYLKLPKSLKELIYTEVKTKLEIELKQYEDKFEKEEIIR